MDDELLWNNMDLIETQARRVGLDAALVSELGFEVLRKATRTYVEGRGEFRAYAKKCLSAAYSDFRRHHIKHVVLDGDPTEDQAVLSFGQKPEPDVSFSAADLDEVRSKLTSDEFDLLMQHYVEGTSMEDLGVRDGVIRQTVWARIRRAMRKLQVA